MQIVSHPGQRIWRASKSAPIQVVSRFSFVFFPFFVSLIKLFSQANLRKPYVTVEFKIKTENQKLNADL